eukprot:12812262-Ditylum_brightwellii.AAC.1
MTNNSDIAPKGTIPGFSLNATSPLLKEVNTQDNPNSAASSLSSDDAVYSNETDQLDEEAIQEA